MGWRLHPISEFETWSNAWQDINMAGVASPLLGPPFLVPLIRTFSSGDEVLAVFGDRRRPAAMAVLARRGRHVWETFQPAQAPLGAWIHHPSLALPFLLRGLLHALPGFPLLLGVTQQDPDRCPAPRSRGQVCTMDYITTARTIVNGSYADYWAAREKKFRAKIRRRMLRLNKAGILSRLQVIRAPEAVAASIEEYGGIESAGWKGRERTAVRGDNKQGIFYRAVEEEFCRRGDGRIYRYCFGDKVVAMQLGIKGNGSLILLKSTYDENYARFSPGILLMRAVYEHAFSDADVRRIELYGRLYWQSEWTDETRTMYHVNCYRWPALARLAAARRRARRTG